MDAVRSGLVRGSLERDGVVRVRHGKGTFVAPGVRPEEKERPRGSLGVDEVRLLVLDPVGATAGAPGAVESVNWTTPWWEWALPFTSATAAYLLASTLVLATRRPLFWAAGLWVAGGVVLGIADFREIDWIQRASDFVAWYIGGDSFTRGMQLPTGGTEVWTLLPSINMWTASSAFWIGLGLVGVLGASSRARNH